MEKEFSSYGEKEQYVQGVFSQIAKHYDLMNKVLSFNQDSNWRNFAIDQMELSSGMRIIDVACGTGMMTKTALQKVPDMRVEGLDFSAEMLMEGRDRLEKANMLDRVNLVEGDAMDLPYGDNVFDGAMSAFALRNVPSIPQVLQEMNRVVKPGGKVVVLELAKPTMAGFKELYYLYFEKILPLLGRLARDNKAYAWLPASLKAYPSQDKVAKLFEEAGLTDVKYYELTGGVVAVHVGVVPEVN